MNSEITSLLNQFRESISPKKYGDLYKIALTPSTEEEIREIETLLKGGEFSYYDMAKLYVLMKEHAVLQMMSALAEIQRTNLHNLPNDKKTKIISPFPHDLLENKNKTLVAKSINDGSKGGNISAKIKKKRLKPLLEAYSKWKNGERTVDNNNGKSFQYGEHGGKVAFDFSMVREGKAHSVESAKQVRLKRERELKEEK